MLVEKKSFHKKGKKVLIKGNPGVINAIHESTIGNKTYVHTMTATLDQVGKPYPYSPVEVDPYSGTQLSNTN